MYMNRQIVYHPFVIVIILTGSVGVTHEAINKVSAFEGWIDK